MTACTCAVQRERTGCTSGRRIWRRRRHAGFWDRTICWVYRLTTSTQLSTAIATGAADYLAIGPVFATGSKENPDPVVGLEGVKAARTLTRLPLVAIGGITTGNARTVIEAGADAVAVISGLLPQGGHEMAERVRDFLAFLR